MTDACPEVLRDERQRREYDRTLSEFDTDCLPVHTNETMGGSWTDSTVWAAYSMNNSSWSFSETDRETRSHEAEISRSDHAFNQGEHVLFANFLVLLLFLITIIEDEPWRDARKMECRSLTQNCHLGSAEIASPSSTVE